MNKFLLLAFMLLPVMLLAQSGKKNFVYINHVTHADLQGRKIIEFIKVNIAELVSTGKKQKVRKKDKTGYLVSFKTVKGKNLGIRGINIENEETGELNYYAIGTRGGLIFEKIANNKIYLKSTAINGDTRANETYFVCSFMLSDVDGLEAVGYQ